MTARTLEALVSRLVRDVDLLKRRTSRISRPTSPALLATAGDVKITARESVQSGWLPAAGATYLISEYPDLYDVLGTRFNTGGEAAGRFRVPNVTAASGLIAVIKA